MKTIEVTKFKNSYQCQECGFHYREKELADKCATWCKEHKSCNLEIVKYATENEKSDSL